MRIRLIFLMVLVLLASCSTRSLPPVVTLVDVPRVAEARTPHEIVWEIELPANSAAAGQFSLHVDDQTHPGTFGTAVSTVLAGYPESLIGTISLTEEGKIRVVFTVEESRPTQVYYRFHINVDGVHYWSPERVLNIIPRPAFTQEFSDSLMTEAIKEFSLF